MRRCSGVGTANKKTRVHVQLFQVELFFIYRLSWFSLSTVSYDRVCASFLCIFASQLPHPHLSNKGTQPNIDTSPARGRRLLPTKPLGQTAQHVACCIRNSVLLNNFKLSMVCLPSPAGLSLPAPFANESEYCEPQR
ncbi:hypothetical protein TRVL_09718 [Trypanosoma vivax]|nr:hypothetical protein TRVL_09718 [Trypanosoma vivax]